MKKDYDIDRFRKLWLNPRIPIPAIADEFDLSISGLRARARSLKLPKVDRMGIARSGIGKVVETSEEPPTINLPPIKLKSYKEGKKRAKAGDPETQILLLGDHHAGEITPTYNKTIYKQRLNELYNSTLTITNLHRNMYPVNDLVIILGGDMVQGENPYQGSNVGTIECGAQEQVYDIALPEILNLILSFKQEFKNIKLYCVRGNHGMYSRIAPRTSNWDIMLYKAMKPLLARYDIETNVSKEFNIIFPVQNFRFFAFHGDQIRSQQGIPYFALTRAIQSWYITYGGFAYGLCFHFHKDDFLRISARAKCFINPPLVSDDPFSLEVVRTSAIPAQTTFGVHSKFGVTWSYSLIVDYNFLPKGEAK